MKTKTNTGRTVPKECRLKNEEMETHISFDLVDRKWNAWTSIKKDIAKLKRQGWTLIKTEYYSDGAVYSATYEAPENAITFRTLEKAKEVEKPKSTRKPLTDEQKEKMRLGRLAKKEAAEKQALQS